ncbi:BTB/POZ domain-containing protein 19, partial [Linnemannia schmuckeri]
MPVYSNPDALGADLLRLVNSPVGADVRLIIGEEKVVMHGHALILQTRSEYFARALTADWKESHQGNIIHKPNILPSIFLQILEFLYTGRIDLSETTIMDLIRAADELCLDDLLFGCERFALTTLCRDNVLEMVELASRHRLGQLKTECLDFIAANIDHLKRGRGICQVEDGILKDILSMDQLDLDELEIWKIAVRWAYFQQGLDWENCPLTEFPKGTGCIVVQPVPDPEEESCVSDAGSLHQDQQKELFDKKASGNGSPGSLSSSSLSDDEMEDARVPLEGTTVHLSSARQRDLDEDGFRPSSHSVFQRNDAYHKIINLPISVHDDLARRILPLLSSIRFLRIPSIDFLRLIEGTGLLPMYLCAKVYRHHSVPSMSDPYQSSLRRRMAFSTILSKDHKEILLEWLQAAIQGVHSGTAGYGWHRSRSTTASSSPTTAIATSPRGGSVSNSLSSSPSSSSFASGVVPSNSPPAYWSRSMSTTNGTIASHRLSSPAATTSSTNTSTLGHRSTRSGSGYSTLTHPGSFTTYPNNITNSPTSQSSSPTPQHVQSQLPLPKLTLQYRASRDGFDAHNFHMACDQRGPTLTVVRADNGTIFGGYNSSSWSSHPSGVYSTSRVNFLFTLKGSGQLTRENTVFGIKGDGNAAAYNKADCGPTFGVGHDLYLAS